MNEEQRKRLAKLIAGLNHLLSEAEELFDYMRYTQKTASAEEEKPLDSELMSLEDAINWLGHAADTFDQAFPRDPLP